MEKQNTTLKTVYCIEPGDGVGPVEWYSSREERSARGSDDDVQWFDLDVPADADDAAIAFLADTAYWSKLYLHGVECRKVSASDEIAKYSALEVLRRYPESATVGEFYDTDSDLRTALSGLMEHSHTSFEYPDFAHLTVGQAAKKAFGLVKEAEAIDHELTTLERFFRLRLVKVGHMQGNMPGEAADLFTSNDAEVATNLISDPMAAAALLYPLLLDLKSGAISNDEARRYGLDNARSGFSRASRINVPIDRLMHGETFTLEASVTVGRGKVVPAGEVWTVVRVQKPAGVLIVTSKNAAGDFLLRQYEGLAISGCLKTEGRDTSKD
ncbi:hypothetical protein [Paraburkholderia sp.]|uniref:hypothetical protein n=1 Tax=Paraburkholderia sp. TaxID=1926495 RepID=UPI003C7C9055